MGAKDNTAVVYEIFQRLFKNTSFIFAMNMVIVNLSRFLQDSLNRKYYSFLSIASSII